MSEDADRFRQRASECRRLAEQAADEYWRTALEALADDLDREADLIDAEEKA